MHFVSSQGIIRLSVVKFSRPPAEHWNVQKPAWRLHLQRCARWIAEVATEVAAEVQHRKRSSEDQAEPSEAAQAAALADMRLGCLSLTRSLLGLELLIEWIVLPPFRSWLGPVQTLHVCLSKSQ